MSNGRSFRLTRGDRRRNAKLELLRTVVRQELAIVGVDLASARQEVVVADHDSRVLARRTVNGSAWTIDGILDWAEPVARERGFDGVVVACEPTGHRWKPVLARTRARGVDLVCVQPLLVHRAREAEDFTKDRSDPKDAVLIARLTTQLRCYVPDAPRGDWARLRHLGARRHALTVAATAARQQLRDLLECVWPNILDTAKKPFESRTWKACLIVSRCDPATAAAMREATFLRRVRAEVVRLGGARISHRVVQAFRAAARAPEGVEWERPAALERASDALADWLRALDELTRVEDRMVDTLRHLELADIVATVPGLSLVGAACILGETGDPTRYDSPRAWVKHAGLAPRDNTSGGFHGTTKVSGRGRPLLRTAAWRAIWGLLPHNDVFRARYQHLTRREQNPLNDGQARAALSAALLRQLHIICTRRVAWDPTVARGEVKTTAA